MPGKTYQVQPHFVFGSLATDDLRLARMKEDRSGLWHDLRLHPLDPQPGQPTTVSIGVGPDVSANHVTIYYTTDGSIPTGFCGDADTGHALTVYKAATEWDTILWGYRDRWEVQIPPQPVGTLVQYIIEAWDDASRENHYAGGDTPQIYSFYVDQERIPGWLKNAVIYQIFVDRFADENGNTLNPPPQGVTGFYGGSLRGILNQLDYLTDLGVDVLWLTPIFASPTYHGYDTIDHGAIEPRLGTEADLHTLIDAAHRRGMRIILDFVANHLSNEHPDFVEARDNPHSPKRDWFFFDDSFDCGYDSFFGVETMPKANTDHPDVRAYFAKHAGYWLNLGIDGYRLDHAQGATHAFWSFFRHTTREAGPDSVTFGEVVETPILQRSFAGRMDGCLDFLLFQVLHNFFGFQMTTVSQLNAFLYRHYSFFPTNYVLPSFLDNHDMNRFLWAVGNDKRRLKLASLCLFTLPGPPILYYGTEVGLSQEENVGRMDHARLPMPWGEDQDAELFDFFQALIALRKQGGTIWRKNRDTLIIDDTRNLYAYKSGPYAIFLNNSAQEINQRLSDWPGASIVLTTDAATTVKDDTLTLPPYGGVCLQRNETWKKS